MCADFLPSESACTPPDSAQNGQSLIYVNLHIFLDDFQALMSETLSFPSGASIGTRSCASIVIEDDDTTEYDELFQAVLTSDLPQVQISPNVTKDIIILNDDGEN